MNSVFIAMWMVGLFLGGISLSICVLATAFDADRISDVFGKIAAFCPLMMVVGFIGGIATL